MGCERSSDCVIVLVAADAAMVQGQRFNTQVLSSFQSGGTCDIADHQRDLGVSNPPVPRRDDERFHVRTASRD